MGIRQRARTGHRIAHCPVDAAGPVTASGARAATGRERPGHPSAALKLTQYYLGADRRLSLTSPPGFRGAGALAGTAATLADAADNPLDAAGGYTVTSDALPPEQFPQFRSAAAGDYLGARSPFQPYDGEWMAAALHRDRSWMRLSRTVDLTGDAAADKPSLRFRLSYDTEPGYDYAIVEAHTVGQDDWTTLPDANGATSTTAPDDCYLTLHPSYVTDSGTGGLGVLADSTALVVGGAERDQEGFETALGPWAVPGAPAGSPANSADWTRSRELFHTSAAVTTRDTVLLGSGLEHIPGAAERTRLVGAALRALRR